MLDYLKMSDEELVKLINDNDDKFAFTQIIIRYRNKTEQHVQGSWGNVIPFDEAADFTHDIFLEMKEKYFKKFDSEKGSFHGFYWTKVKNRLCELHEEKTHAKADKKRAAEGKVPIERDVTYSFDPTNAFNVPRKEDPDMQVGIALSAHILVSQITHALSLVSNNSYRRSFLLKLLYGNKNAYLGDLLGVPESTFKSNYFRAGEQVLEGIRGYFEFDFLEIVGEVLDGTDGKLLDRKSMFDCIKTAKTKKLFYVIQDYESIGELCSANKFDEKEVIDMVHKGLDEMLPGKNGDDKPPTGLPDDKKIESIEKGFEEAAGGKKKKKRKIRGTKEPSEAQKYEDFGSFLFSIFNEPPKSVKEKSLLEVYENAMKNGGTSDKEMAKKLGMGSVAQLAKNILKSDKNNKTFMNGIEENLVKQRGVVYEACEVAPEKINTGKARQRSAELQEETAKIMKILDDSNKL